MGFRCPRCSGHYTQSLPMVYSAGTSSRNWVSRSGYRGNTLSQSLLAQQANPPVKRSVLKPLFWLLVVWFLLGGAIASTVAAFARGPAPVRTVQTGRRARHRQPGYGPTLPLPPSANPVQANPRAQEQIVLVLGGVGALLGFLLLWRAVAAFRWNRRTFPGLLQQWQMAFMCRDCGALFYPPDAHAVVLSG